MAKLIDDKEFEKVEIIRTLFTRCSLAELLVIEQKALKGEFRQRSVNQTNNTNKQSDIQAELNNNGKRDLEIDVNCLI